MDTSRIEREVIIESPIERVWTLLTSAEHLRTWFAFDGAEIDLRPGGAITFRWKEHGTFFATIEAVEPLRRFVFRWALPPDQVPVAGNSTRVEFTLEPTGPDRKATLLRLLETGFDDLDPAVVDRAKSHGENVQGWKGAFESLIAYTARDASRVAS